MEKKVLSPMMRRTLDEVVNLAAHAPRELGEASAFTVLKSMRQALGMTQAQLARRAGITQSHLARIELGIVDPQLGTLRKLSKALFCDLLVIPSPKKSIESTLQERAEARARRNVARVSGTMALERQLPDDWAIKDMVQSEKLRLLRDRPSELWEE